MPLVVAYDECIDPNRTHGPPLADGSCALPAPASQHLTVGTADSNGQPTKSIARAKLGVLAGNPGTPADEADVSITVDITDVRRQSDLSDYTGELRTERSLRLIDRDGGTAATMVETPYSFMIPCAATADTTIGGHCALDHRRCARAGHHRRAQPRDLGARFPARIRRRHRRGRRHDRRQHPLPGARLLRALTLPIIPRRSHRSRRGGS